MRKGSRGGLAAVVVLFTAAASAGYACIPEPDTSGLPARDAGPDATYIPSPVDGGGDAILEAGADADADAGAVDGGSGPGSIHGVVLNFGEGMGRGVLPGATITIAGSSPALSAVSGIHGEFAFTNVPAGRVVLDVTHPTDKAKGLAYGSTQIAVSVAPGHDVSVFPMVHTGCFVTFTNADLATGMLKRLQDGCEGRSGAYASVFIPDIAALQTQSNHQVYAGTARVELIPIAFPLTVNDATDFTWSLGMPDIASSTGNAGAQVPAPLDFVGAAEIRVVVDGTNGGLLDGTPLEPASGHPATIEVPVQRLPQGGEQLTPWYYDRSTSHAWQPDTTATGVTFGQPDAGPQQLDVVRMSVTRFGWFGVGALRTQGGCVVGSISVNGAPRAGAFVRGIGTSYVGSTTAVTADNGTFCLDLKASANAEIVAGYTQPSGGSFAVVTPPGNTGNAGASCQANASACKQAGVIPLTAVDGACVDVTVLNASTPVTIPLDVYAAKLPNVGPDEINAGISNRAYIGHVTPSASGAVCIPSTPNDSLELQDPAGTLCAGGVASLNVPAGLASAACGSAACADAGTASFACP